VDYTILPFPCERHVPRGLADRMYMERSIFHFFEGALASPPNGPSPASSSFMNVGETERQRQQE
jgi:hypothetical protein